MRNCLEELLLKMYGPLDNVPAWHYSEAVKNVPGQKNGESSNAVTSKVRMSVKFCRFIIAKCL